MNNDYALWILFSIFVGIALSIDLGLFGKLKNIMIKQKEKNSFHNHTQDILDSNHESIQKLQQHTRDALKWTIVWISLAGIFAMISIFVKVELFCTTCALPVVFTTAADPIIKPAGSGSVIRTLVALLGPAFLVTIW